MIKENNKEKLFDKNDIALFIAPITALCYGLTYIKKLGTYIYYGIPPALIDLNINSLTVGILSFSPFLIVIIYFFYRMIRKIKKYKPQEKKITKKKNKVVDLILFITSIALYGIIHYFYQRSFGNITYLFFVNGLLLAIGIISIYVFYKKKNYFLTLIVGILYSSFLSFTLGIGGGALNISYTIIQVNNQDYVLLETYKEHYIIAPVDLNSKVISRKITLKSFSDDDYTISQKRVILKIID
jgi:hypothetical protein